MNLARALDENAARRGAHTAIVDGDRFLTYAGLAPLVRRTASYLRGLGAGEGSIIGVSLKDTADHLVALFAIARSGAIILPLDWRWTEAETRRVCEFFGVALALVEPGGRIGGTRCLVVDDDWHAAIGGQPDDPFCAAGGAAPVVLSLSSGTTGRPKGPLLTHDQFIARFVMQWVTLGFNQHDRYLSATPVYFGGGRSFTMGCLFTGSTVIMFPPPYEPEELVAASVRHDATTLLLVPTLLRRLLDMPSGNRVLMPTLSRLLSTGAVLHPDERDAVMRRLNPNFINYYGSTEGGGTSVLLPKHQGEAAKSVGEPVYRTEIQVVDDDGSTMAPGEAGHIRYRSPGMPDGFYNDPVASAEAFRDGWFYPGDIGRMDDEGLLYLVGRSKDVIIRGGVNIYPGEIEQTLLDHPSVRDAVAVAWPHPERGEDVAVYVVTNGHATEKELAEFCGKSLAPYKVPSGIFFVDDMPKTGLGKIIKDELIARLPARKA